MWKPRSPSIEKPSPEAFRPGGRVRLAVRVEALLEVSELEVRGAEGAEARRVAGAVLDDALEGVDGVLGEAEVPVGVREEEVRGGEGRGPHAKGLRGQRVRPRLAEDARAARLHVGDAAARDCGS